MVKRTGIEYEEMRERERRATYQSAWSQVPSPLLLECPCSDELHWRWPRHCVRMRSVDTNEHMYMGYITRVNSVLKNQLLVLFV